MISVYTCTYEKVKECLRAVCVKQIECMSGKWFVLFKYKQEKYATLRLYESEKSYDQHRSHEYIHA